MRSQVIFSTIALLLGLASALPNSVEETGELVRRGMPPGNDTCVDCPPEPCFNCTTGCLSIQCQGCGCDDKGDCCAVLGLGTDRHFLYYPDPLVGAPNIQLDPSPNAKAHEFEWCPASYQLYSDGKTTVVPVGFSGGFSGEWYLQSDGAFFQVGAGGLVSTLDGSTTGDSDHFWVCKVAGIYRVFYSYFNPGTCCPVSVYFTSGQ